MSVGELTFLELCERLTSSLGGSTLFVFSLRRWTLLILVQCRS